MDRLRKSFRGSFRRRKDPITESSKAHRWQADEQAVRSGNCSFHVKYLGCVEVFDSRGMHVCEEALRVLRKSGRRPTKGTLFVTGDGLRVVDEKSKGLLLDQTIEKVSFCAPDRNHDRGFSYICRDGTTRRWMCHGFHASKDCGDRLSHAVGCAFAVCLERKQKRDKELVSMNFDSKASTFTRTGSFRQASLTERLTDIQNFKPSEPPPLKPVHNPYAIERPHATPQLLERQGSFRGLGGLNQTSPFKRQLSLRLSDLPSNLERTRSHSFESSESFPPIRPNGALTVTPIPEASPGSENKLDSITAMCKELSQGLSLLSRTDEPKFTFTSDKNYSKSQSITSKDVSIGTPSPPPLSSAFATTVDTPTPFGRTDFSTKSSPFDAKFDEKNFGDILNNFSSSSTSSAFTSLSKTLDGEQDGWSVDSNKSPFSSDPTDCFEPSFVPKSSPFNSDSSFLSSGPLSNRKISSTLKSDPVRKPLDPFDADWVPPLNSNQNNQSNLHKSTNPFLPSSGAVKTFQIKM